jgi:hypothetical protein
MDEWNGFSNILKWIIEYIDIFLIADIIRIPFDKITHY